MRSESTSYYNIACQIQKDPQIEKYMKISLIHYFFYRGEGSRGEGRGGDVRRVVLREEREEERYVIQSITFQDQVSASFNQLNQRWSLKEFRTECIKEHCVSLSNQLYCIVGG